MKKLWARLVELNKTDPEVLSPSLNVLLDKVRSEPFVFLTNSLTAQVAMSEDSSMRRFLISPTYSGLALQKGSPYTERMSWR